MTLEQLLRNHPNGRFRLSTNGIDPVKVRLYIHPDGEDGSTLNYYCIGDALIPAESIDDRGGYVHPLNPPEFGGAA